MTVRTQGLGGDRDLISFYTRLYILLFQNKEDSGCGIRDVSCNRKYCWKVKKQSFAHLNGGS